MPVLREPNHRGIDKYYNHLYHYRKQNPGKKCKKCGIPLSSSKHHHYCNTCWWLIPYQEFQEVPPIS